jgi:NAD(P)-dependent dehydrogenase (short-subunit alcohol dehydrogenase family)
VVITGAFGGVGREICRRMLAASGAADHDRSALFLVGRHPPADPAAWAAELIEPRPAESLPAPVQHSAGLAQLRLPGGPDLWFCRADVSLSAEVDALFAAMVEAMSAPGTTTQLEVHHCAGLLRDGLLVDLAWESFAAVMGPKAVGAFNLLRGCQRHNLALRSFALCSSVTNVVGTAGQVRTHRTRWTTPPTSELTSVVSCCGVLGQLRGGQFDGGVHGGAL